MSAKIGFAPILATALLICPASAQSADERWVLIDGNDSAVYFIDNATKSKEGNIALVWEVNFPSKNGNRMKRFDKVLNAYDCSKRVWQIREIITEYTSGKSDNVDQASRWVNIPPESIAESSFNYACFGTFKYGNSMPPVTFERAESAVKEISKQ